MRILSLAVLAVVTNEVEGFTPMSRSSSSRVSASKTTVASETTSSLHMSSYLDSLSAYTAYQQEKQKETTTSANGATETKVINGSTNGEVTPEAINGATTNGAAVNGAASTEGAVNGATNGAGATTDGATTNGAAVNGADKGAINGGSTNGATALESNLDLDAIVVPSPKVAGATMAPPSTTKATPEVVETKPVEIEAEIEVKESPTTKEREEAKETKTKPPPPPKAKAKKEVKQPKIPPPPPAGTIVEPSKVAFAGGERSKDVVEEAETNKLINSIGFAVTVSLYVGIPWALFGLPPDAFLNKVEGQISEWVGGEGSGTATPREEMMNKGIVQSRDPYKSPSSVVTDGVGAAQSAYDAVAKSGVAEKFQGWVDREMRLAKNPQPMDVDSIRNRLMYGNYKKPSTTISEEVFSTKSAASETPAPPAVERPAPANVVAAAAVEMPAPPAMEAAAVQTPAITTPVPAAVETPAAPSTQVAAATTPEYPSTPLPLAQAQVSGEAQVNPVAAAATAATPESQPVSWQQDQYYNPHEQQPSTTWEQYYQEEQSQPSWQDQYYQQQQDEQQMSWQDQYYQQQESQQGYWHNEYYHQEQEEEQTQPVSYEWQGPYYEEYRDESLF